MSATAASRLPKFLNPLSKEFSGNAPVTRAFMEVALNCVRGLPDPVRGTSLTPISVGKPPKCLLSANGTCNIYFSPLTVAVSQVLSEAGLSEGSSTYPTKYSLVSPL